MGFAAGTSTLAGQPFEIAFGGAPLRAAGQGAILTADGQILNLDVSDPTLTLLFGGFLSPPFQNFSIPLSSTVPFAASIQMGVLDPNAPSGLRLSQPVRLLIP